jgi:hypothetical protein
VAEAFNQAIKENKPREEMPATTLVRWFDCFHHSRVVSLVVFLLMIVPFFQGNQKYLYLQYIEPLHSPHPPKSISASWLNFDCMVFSIEAGLFFLMARSLSAQRWQQFYAAIIVLLSLDLVWAAIEKLRHSAVPSEWLWFDGLVALVLAAIILIDWFIVRYDREKQLNRYCFWAASLVTILCLIFGYFYELDYVIE